MLEYFLSLAKADLLPTDGGSSARSDPPGYGDDSFNRLKPRHHTSQYAIIKIL